MPIQPNGEDMVIMRNDGDIVRDKHKTCSIFDTSCLALRS